MERDEELAERVRQACLQAAVEAWEEARLVGLCADGAWEAAVGAMRALPLERVLAGRAEEPEGDR